MRMTRTFTIFALGLLAACQGASAPSTEITVLDVPASDDVEALDRSKLPDGFPILAEMIFPTKPAKCGLSKFDRLASLDDGSAGSHDNHFVFAFHEVDENTGEPIHHVGINGVLHELKPSGSADRGSQTIRYFKTTDGSDVEVMVAITPGEGTTKSTGTLGRVKAWDGDIPLMCAYNMVQVAGDCDL